MTPEVRDLVMEAVGNLHDDLLTKGRAMYPKESYPYGRPLVARRLRLARRALREMRHFPIALPRNDCE